MTQLVTQSVIDAFFDAKQKNKKKK